MIKIKRISNEDEIHFFKFDTTIDVHNQLISFLNTLQFPETELIKIDTPFTELDGEYLYVKTESMKIHFFITKKEVNIVIDSPIPQKELSDLMKNHFIFP